MEKDLRALLNEKESTTKNVLSLGKINSSYKKTLIIYGGSVNNKNSVNFLKSEFIDGLLVGGTSLKVDKFISILNCK